MHVSPFVSGSTLVGATVLSYQNAGGAAGSQADPLPPMDAPRGQREVVLEDKGEEKCPLNWEGILRWKMRQAAPSNQWISLLLGNLLAGWRTLENPWDTKEIKLQSILKEIHSEYSLEALMLKLKLQYFGHPMQRAGSLEKPLMLGKTEGKRRRGWQRIRWLDGITDSRDMNLSKPCETVCSTRTGKPGVLQSMRPQRVGHTLVMEQKQPAGWDQAEDEQKHSTVFCTPEGSVTVLQLTQGVGCTLGNRVCFPKLRWLVTSLMEPGGHQQRSSSNHICSPRSLFFKSIFIC